MSNKRKITGPPRLRVDPRRRAAEAKVILDELFRLRALGDKEAVWSRAGEVAADPELAGAVILTAVEALDAMADTLARDG